MSYRTDRSADMTLSPAAAAVWRKASAMNCGALYSTATRNPDKAIRDKFRSDRYIPGTKAWGICQAVRISTCNPSDEECEAIVAALDN